MVKPGPKQEKWRLQLFVLDDTARSVNAIRNLREVCEKSLKGRYSIEIFDVKEHPELTVKKQIVAIPMLIKMAPLPMMRMVGDLSTTEKVKIGLGLATQRTVLKH